VGKTRIALSVAGEQLSVFKHGVFFVDLSGVTDRTNLAPAIGHALHLAEPAEGTWLDALRSELREKEILLVLDNFEQIVSAGPIVTDILAACPGLKIIVTSRQSLQVSGEHELPLPPLATPAPDAIDLKDPEANEAINLFVRRAQAVRPSFTLHRGERGRRRRDLPPPRRPSLAIELAAARVKLLQPRELLTRLKDASTGARALNVLTGGRQDASARHQTLRAAIDWSYQLLTMDEQRLFCRLGVFHGAIHARRRGGRLRGRRDRRHRDPHFGIRQESRSDR
jgi:predicted ATPase